MFFFIDENTKTIGLEKKHIHSTSVKFQIKKKRFSLKSFFRTKYWIFYEGLIKSVCVCACVWALTNVLCIFNFENSNSNPHKCFYIEMFRSPDCRVQSTLWKVKLFSVFFLLMNSKKNFFFTIKKIFFRIQHSFQFAYEPVLALHTYKGNNDVMYPVAEKV